MGIITDLKHGALGLAIASLIIANLTFKETAEDTFSVIFLVGTIAWVCLIVIGKGIKTGFFKDLWDKGGH